jgi:hypothetical protein
MGAITLQFVGNDSLGSRLIEWYDHGQFSHVDTVLPDGSLLGARNDVLGSIPAGVQIRPAGYVVGDRMKRVAIPCSDIREQNYYDFVESQIGKPYDQLAIAAFCAGRDWRDESAWFCSELVAAGLEEALVVFPLTAPVNKIAPDDLLLLISAMVNIV